MIDAKQTEAQETEAQPFHPERVKGQQKRADRMAELLMALAMNIARIDHPRTAIEVALEELFYGIQDYLDGKTRWTDLDKDVAEFVEKIQALRRGCPDCGGIGMPVQESCKCGGKGWIWK